MPRQAKYRPHPAQVEMLLESPSPLQPVPMTVFPTMESLQGATDYAKSRLPITTENELHGVLMVYHNTMLHLIQSLNSKPAK